MRHVVLSSFTVAFAVAISLSVPAVAQTPKLTKAQAQAIALKLHPGKIKSAELETEKGIQQYSFDIQTKDGLREVGVDAATGKIVEDSVESPADEAREKAAEKSPK